MPYLYSNCLCKRACFREGCCQWWHCECHTVFRPAITRQTVAFAGDFSSCRSADYRITSLHYTTASNMKPVMSYTKHALSPALQGDVHISMHGALSWACMLLMHQGQGQWKGLGERGDV